MFPVIMIAGIRVPVFNVCAGCGFLVAILYFGVHTKKEFSPHNQDTVIAMMGADIPFVIAGAWIHNKIVYAHSVSQFVSNLTKNTGIAFLGGLTGGVVGLLLLFQIMGEKELKMEEVINGLVPSVVLGHAIGRIGCLMGGCCYGKPAALGIVFQKGTPAFLTYGNRPLFPTQLVEAVMLMMIFFVVKRKKNHAATFYLMSYSVLRFLLEFMRGDNRGGGIAFFSPAQILCILIFFGTFIFHQVYQMVRKTMNAASHK